MPKFTKKPVEIEARKFEGTNQSEIIDWVLSNGGTAIWSCNSTPYHWLKIETLEGAMHADKGDYIIKGVKGEFYPCKPDIFEATYDAAGH